VSLIALFSLATSHAQGEEIKIVLWNARTLFDVATVNDRADDLRDFGQHFAGADISRAAKCLSTKTVNKSDC